MTVGDIGEVCAIETEVFPNPWPRSAFEQDVRNDSNLCTVVRDSSGILVGYACLMIIVDEAHLTNIAVTGAYRRQGIGSLLLHDMISKAEIRRCRAMFLEVRRSNLDARAFYARYGFTELYRRRDYYRRPVEDALILVCPIGERNSRG
jgi:ribosomal-protein-alanine N-acetyltransferase